MVGNLTANDFGYLGRRLLQIVGSKFQSVMLFIFGKRSLILTKIIVIYQKTLIILTNTSAETRNTARKLSNTGSDSDRVVATLLAGCTWRKAGDPVARCAILS